MSTSIVIRSDILMNVYRSAGVEDNVGFSSQYTTQAHPGTNTKIEGWHWDSRTWPSENEELQEYCIPTLYDPGFYTAENGDWQSGIGHGDDLELLDVVYEIRDGQQEWAPKVRHGYFYLYDQEYYLYSDGLVTTTVPYQLDSGNFQYIELPEVPKATIPIRVYDYYYDNIHGQHLLHRLFRRKVDFTPLVSSGEYLDIRDDDDNLIYDNINSNNPEFIVEYDDYTDPPTITLNGNYLTSVYNGVSLSGVEGLVEKVGESAGGANQIFYTHYSPLCSGIEARVWTYASTTTPTEWAVLSGVNPTFSGGERECYLDYDTGMLQFGDYDPVALTGDGLKPSYGHSVAVQYSGTLFVDFEAEGTPDFRISENADLNVLHGSSPKGFVHIGAGAQNAATLELSADLPVISTNRYGPLYLGYNYAQLSCLVQDENGANLEGATVTFEIVGATVGSFGLEEGETEAITNYNGEAITFYNPPVNISEVGDATDEVIVGSGYNALYFPDLNPPSNDDPLYLFKVVRNDYILGIPEDTLTGEGGYYETYFDEESIGYTSLGDEETWEATYRDIYDLPTPLTYLDSDLVTGSKRAVLFWDTEALNPETGVFGAWAMLQPEEYTVTDSGINVYYDTSLDAITDSGEFKSYFIASSSEVSIRASVYNSVLRRRIYSNTITIQLLIPDYMNGTYYAESLASLPSGLLQRPKNDTEFQTYFDTYVYNGVTWVSSGLQELYYEEREWDDSTEDVEVPWVWFQRTRRADNVLLGLESVDISEVGATTIPLGFRIRSAGVTLASALGGVTFLNPNSTLLSGVFD